MALVSKQIASLFNGVSQQPATLRLPSQVEEQINGYPTVVDGLRKRPGSEWVAQVSATSLSSAHLHTINRDVSERYAVVITDGDLKVYDLADGSEQTVNFPKGKGYLDLAGVGADAKNKFSVVTVADYSFVTNKEVVVATKASPTAVPADYTAGDWYVQPRSGWERQSGSAENERRFYNQAHVAYQGEKQTFQDLPASPTTGDVWKIKGSDADGFASYYVIWTGNVWEETHGNNRALTLDETTMPHALVRESNGDFTFKPFAWSVRRVGDDYTNPPPTCVGRTIEDVFYYKNRLGFTTDENTVFSAAGDFGNFWRNTVVDLLDSDVVDVAVSSKNVALLKYAVPFNNKLMLFADQTQFALNVDQLLTPNTVSIDAVTDYEMSTKARPVAIGDDVFFVTEAGPYSRIREYYVDDGDSNNTDAADITAHVPRYLPKNIFKLTGNANEDVLFVLSSDQPTRVYVYKFYWNEDGKIQSSWGYWDFSAASSILDIEAIDNELYMLIERSNGEVDLDKVDLQSGAVTGALAHPVLLDRLTDVTGVYDAGNDWTTFTLPYTVAAGDQAGYKLVRGADFGSSQEALIDPTQYTWVNDTTVRVPGDESAGECHCGDNYEFTFTFSEQFISNRDVAVTTGRLMLRTFVVYFTDTAFFSTEVSPYGTDPLVEAIVPASIANFTGKTLGADSLTLGTPQYHTGSYAFQVYGDSRVAKVKIKNDTHVQCKFQSAEWEGLYHNRARVM